MQFLPNREIKKTRMKQAITIQSLSGIKLEDIRQTLIAAFSEYSVPMNPNLNDFRSRMERNAFAAHLSAGIFRKSNLVGFILSGIGEFQQEKVAYNAGTGIIPSFRRQGLTLKMYNHLLPLFIEHKIEASILEVITTNTSAINAYQKVGFNIVREFECLQLGRLLAESKAEIPLKISKVTVPDWQLYAAMLSYVPSWQFSKQSISRALSNEVVLEATSQMELAGYISFVPYSGKISQTGVAEKFRGRNVGKQLVRAAQALSTSKKIIVLNIDKTAEPIIAFFKALGFQHFLSQYEMRLAVS